MCKQLCLTFTCVYFIRKIPVLGEKSWFTVHWVKNKSWIIFFFKHDFIRRNFLLKIV